MAIARVVTFEGVSTQRIEELKREIEEGDRPGEVPAKEILILHDAESEKSIAILLFESEDDYSRGDEVLNARPTERHSRPAHVGDEVRRRRSKIAVAGRAELQPRVTCAATASQRPSRRAQTSV